MAYKIEPCIVSVLSHPIKLNHIYTSSCYRFQSALMAKQHILLLILVASIHHIAYAAATTTSVNLTADATTTAYNILEKNNFPRGLFPKGVRSYILSPDGKLEVTLLGECRFPVNLGYT